MVWFTIKVMKDAHSLGSPGGVAMFMTHYFLEQGKGSTTFGLGVLSRLQVQVSFGYIEEYHPLGEVVHFVCFLHVLNALRVAFYGFGEFTSLLVDVACQPGAV